ncbi:lactonase family protein [Cellulosimicrobium cellulans]|uniref:lactonase family protein n=1 Tax=Cellulosimicrobium cellulans TaxID=1710 RepID=UPI000848F26C|nr:beta-propeller fold lactonase family protein [Cellulosimicrobium cellulans]
MTVATRSLWIGTYPHPAAADGEGVWRVELDTSKAAFTGGRLVMNASSPSFLALARPEPGTAQPGDGPSGGVLYAVGETDDGTVSAFAVDADGGLVPHGPTVPSGGSSPCHVLARDGHVLVANYADGVLGVAATDGSGALAGPARPEPHSGTGPDAERQEGPHAHFVLDDGRGGVLVSDLGTDELRRHDVDADGRAPEGAASRVAATFPPGTGPRHLAVLAGGCLVAVGELDPALFVLAPGPDGSYDVVARYDVTRAAAPDGRPHQPSHVDVAADGTRVLVAVRGSDVLAVHAVVPAPDGGAPTLEHLADTPVGGAWPRHFAVLRDPALDEGADGTADVTHDLVVVANQEDDPGAADGDGPTSNLALLRVARADGTGEVLDVFALPAPACVVEVPRT